MFEMLSECKYVVAFTRKFFVCVITSYSVVDMICL